ncbi:hypothetical protein HHK36_030734 [Tetracentron sinense]|uniref:Uncharacterized protein n=1 Tax=Tetracentron sinense TaxID=13715 RepID=A0A834YC79_TETSI|nr:hypothetical protein HHK36_030734 [Tetracentron sinense]
MGGRLREAASRGRILIIWVTVIWMPSSLVAHYGIAWEEKERNFKSMIDYSMGVEYGGKRNRRQRRQCGLRNSGHGRQGNGVVGRGGKVAFGNGIGGNVGLGNKGTTGKVGTGGGIAGVSKRWRAARHISMLENAQAMQCFAQGVVLNEEMIRRRSSLGFL